MDAQELINYITKFNEPGFEMHVCTLDQLPKELKKKEITYGFLINLTKNNSTKNVNRWIALYIDSSRNGYYLSSQGFIPKNRNLKSFIKRNCKYVEYCVHQLQQLKSNVSGMYAACFVIHMLMGFAHWSFKERFSEKISYNDSFLIKYYYHNLKY